MNRYGLIAAMAMATMAGGVGMAGHPVELIEAPAPKRSRRSVLTTYAEPPRTPRTPHIGFKERARHAGKPDGPMHGLPPPFRA